MGKNVIVGGFMRIEAKFWTSIELIHMQDKKAISFIEAAHPK